MSHRTVLCRGITPAILVVGLVSFAFLCAPCAGADEKRPSSYSPVVHLRMLEIAEKHEFRFDTVQMPLNVMDAHFRSFQHLVLPLLLKKQIGVLGMKSMADGMILKSNVVTPVECLQYSLSLPISTQITGIDSMDVLRQDLDLVRTFKPLTLEQTKALLERTAVAAADGQYEKFKMGNTRSSRRAIVSMARHTIRSGWAKSAPDN